MNIRRRPTMSPSRPPATRVSPNVSAYPDTIHCTDWEEAPSPCSIEGTATFTIVTSSRDMNPTSRVTARARHRFGSGSGGLVIRPCGYPRAAVGNDNQRFVSRGETMTDTTVALLGTGTMGAGMARNIAAAGIPLRAWNRTVERARPLADV